MFRHLSSSATLRHHDANYCTVSLQPVTPRDKTASYAMRASSLPTSPGVRFACSLVLMPVGFTAVERIPHDYLCQPSEGRQGALGTP